MTESIRPSESPPTDFRSIKPMSQARLSELSGSEETHVTGHGALIFIFGKRFYGPVDEHPGMFYVATSFWHLWFFPLIPCESWLLFEDSVGRSGLQGVPIALSWKSVLFAWFRAICTVFGVIFSIAALGGFLLFQPPGTKTWRSLFLAGLMIGGLFLTRGLRRASPTRTLELGELAQLTPEEIKDFRQRLDRSQA